MSQRLYCYPRYHILDPIVSEKIIAKDPLATVISITSTTDKCPEPREFGLQDPWYCYCLKFDDIGPNENCKNWHCPKAITPEQAEGLVDFIEKNIDRNFYIHCDAGASRSQAVVRFILDCYGENHEWEIRKENPPEMPNHYVLWALKRVWRKKNYPDIEFPEDD